MEKIQGGTPRGTFALGCDTLPAKFRLEGRRKLKLWTPTVSGANHALPNRLWHQVFLVSFELHSSLASSVRLMIQGHGVIRAVQYLGAFPLLGSRHTSPD